MGCCSSSRGGGGGGGGEGEGFWDGFAARVERGGRLDWDIAVEKGLVDCEDPENGLACEESVNGFIGPTVAGAPPNKASPMFRCTVSGSFFSPSSPFLAFPPPTSPPLFTRLTLTPLSTLTLPSLRPHVFLRHASTYSLRSCPGNTSGRSPLSCKSSTIKSLQVLQRASRAEGGEFESSHT